MARICVCLPLVEHVLLILGFNALAQTRKGKVRIFSYFKRKWTSKKRELFLKVDDSGCGFTEETLAQLLSQVHSFPEETQPGPARSLLVAKLIASHFEGIL
jgi:signal transduction histidine kinase